MKYFGLFLVAVVIGLALFIGTQSNSLNSEEQQKLLGVIEDYMTEKVLQKEPNAKEIQFSDLHVEEIEEGKALKAHFKFSYIQTDASNNSQRVFRKGNFLVASNDGNQWKAKINDINDVQVEFMNGLEIESDPTQLPKKITDEGAPGPDTVPNPVNIESNSETNSQ